MVLHGRTREQIRVSVGYNLGAIYVSSTSSTAGNANSVLDTSLRGGNNVHNGKWIVSTSGTNDGEITRVSDYVQSSADMTVSPAFGATVPNGMTYEMWEPRFPPANIHEFINQAIMEVAGRAYDPEESLAFYGDSLTARFDIPSEFNMLDAVAYRDYVKAEVLDECDATFTTISGSVSQVVDTEVKKHGAAAVKFTVPVSHGAQEIAHDDFTAVDISAMTHIEYWIRSSVARSAGDNAIRLGEGATQRELLEVPALSADTWTFVSTALAATEVDTAIDELRVINYDANPVYTLWVDYFRVVDNNHATYTPLPSHYWRVDKPNRDLILTGVAVAEVGNNAIKVRGGGMPVLLTSDATATEVNDEYLIARATALALASVSGKAGGDAQHIRSQLGYWTAVAEQKRAELPFLVNVREVA